MCTYKISSRIKFITLKTIAFFIINKLFSLFIKNRYFSLDVISSDDEQINRPDSKSSASGSYSEKKHLNQIEDFRPEIQDKKETIKSIDEPDHQELTNGGNIDGQENRFGEELDITI